MTTLPDNLRDDLLTGASEIADYTGWPVRRIYHAAARGYLPISHCGATLIARKSELSLAMSGKSANEPEAE